MFEIFKSNKALQKQIESLKSENTKLTIINKEYNDTIIPAVVTVYSTVLDSFRKSTTCDSLDDASSCIAKLTEYFSNK